MALTKVDGTMLDDYLISTYRVRVAATGNVVIASALEVGDSIDGVTLALDDEVLLPLQSSSSENGLYRVKASGAAARVPLFATYNSMAGLKITVLEGTANADTEWLGVSNRGGTINSTALAFINLTPSTTKTTPVDADELVIFDSAESSKRKRLSFTNMRLWLRNFFPKPKNYLINGDFDIWQRATTQTASGYGSDDRWGNEIAGQTQSVNRFLHTLGQTLVPGNPRYFSYTTIAGAGSSSAYVVKYQKIEGVKTLAGKQATLIWYQYADAGQKVGLEIAQSFGTGGSPSALVSTPIGQFAPTSGFQKFSQLITIPSITGKVLGSNGDDYLSVNFWYSAGSSFASRASSIGVQTGTFGISHVSFNEGNCTSDPDPFEERHPQQELALCQRYFEVGRSLWSGMITSGQVYYDNNYYRVTKRIAATLVITNSGAVGFANVAPTIQSLGAWSTMGFQASRSGTATQTGYHEYTWTSDAEL